ncbi:MAG: hypothetical protein AB1722_11545 [Pseudomonadota bacterium]
MLVIPVQAGIQLIERPRVAGQNQIVGFAGFYFRWIPACAGMTDTESKR